MMEMNYCVVCIEVKEDTPEQHACLLRKGLFEGFADVKMLV